MNPGGWHDFRVQVQWAHILVAALADYYFWRELYDCMEERGDRPCHWTWDRMMEKTQEEWHR